MIYLNILLFMFTIFASGYICLIQIPAWPCGSMSNGHLDEVVTIKAFCVDYSSVGRAFNLQFPITASLVRNVMSYDSIFLVNGSFLSYMSFIQY